MATTKPQIDVSRTGYAVKCPACHAAPDEPCLDEDGAYIFTGLHEARLGIQAEPEDLTWNPAQGRFLI